MAVDIEDDVVILARHGRNNAKVRLVSGRKDHGVIHGVEVLESLFDRLVGDISAIKDAASGGTRAELVERLLARRDHVRVKGHPHVIIGAEQDRLAPVAYGDRRADHFFHYQAEWIGYRTR